jgi:hypothetical protein
LRAILAAIDAGRAREAAEAKPEPAWTA